MTAQTATSYCGLHIRLEHLRQLKLQLPIMDFILDCTFLFIL